MTRYHLTFISGPTFLTGISPSSLQPSTDLTLFLDGFCGLEVSTNCWITFPNVAHIRRAFGCQGTVGSQNNVVLLQIRYGCRSFRTVMNENLHETFSGLAFNFILPSLEHNEPLKTMSQKEDSLR